jgi:hypothetical protein
MLGASAVKWRDIGGSSCRTLLLLSIKNLSHWRRKFFCSCVLLKSLRKNSEKELRCELKITIIGYLFKLPDLIYI